MSIIISAGLLFVALMTGPIAVHAASFTGLGTGPGFAISGANAVSANGSVVTGIYATDYPAFSEAIRWTSATGRQGLGYLDEGGRTRGMAVSADGNVIVGLSGGPSGFERQQAFRWTEDEGMQGIGGLPGSVLSYAWGVSDDGTVIVGDSYIPDDGSTRVRHAFRWAEGVGMQGLGTLPGMIGSIAMDTTADGLVVVGAGTDGPDEEVMEAYRWTASDGMQALGYLPGGVSHSWASAITSDGSIIVGESASANAHEEAFVWDATNGMRGLGFVPGWGPSSTALGVSSDGTVIVGQAGPDTSVPTAFIWTPEHGMREVRVVLQSLGVDTDGWQLIRAWDVSDDGSTIVGIGFNPMGRQEGWVAVIPEPSTTLLLGMGFVGLALRHSRSTMGTLD